MKTILLSFFTLILIACGSSSGGEHSSVSIGDISPLIDVNDTYLIEENTQEAFQIKARDNSTLKYYISGKDAHLLYIDTITGAIFFYEPTNYTKYPIYNFTLIVEDSIGNRTIKEITIQIKKSPNLLLDTTKRAFITVWKTDNRGASQDTQITIPTKGKGYNYFIDWGDGSNSKNITHDATHTYSHADTYTVKIKGKFPRIVFQTQGVGESDAQKLLTIEQWGDNEWESMEGAFAGCSNMILTATDNPNLSKVSNMNRMFSRCESFDQDISSWDTSHINTMLAMFYGTSFNQEISSWDVSHVKNMSSMFVMSKFNQDISSWDVSAVTTMNGMFAMSEFNQNINSWNVSAVTNMSSMFELSAFNQDISSWNVSSVTDMSAIFKYARNFNQDITLWNTSSVRNMYSMFMGNKAFMYQDLSSWKVQNVAPDAHNNFLKDAGEGNIEPKWRQ